MSHLRGVTRRRRSSSSELENLGQKEEADISASSLRGVVSLGVIVRKEPTPVKLDQQTHTQRMNIQMASIVWSLLAIDSYRVTLVRS